MIQKSAGKAGKGTPRKGGAVRLYSVAALLKERSFAGNFETGGSHFEFTYVPLKASTAGRKLILQGPLTVTDSRGNKRVRDRVQALLAATQGGVGGIAPPRPQLSPRVGMTTEPPRSSSSSPSQTESTGPLSFTGAMYFQFEPLDGRALGVKSDLSRVQLNVRLAPVDSTARSLQGVYSAIVDALYGEKADDDAAKAYVGELNRILSA